METTTVEAPVTTECSECQGENWRYVVIYTTMISTGDRIQTGEEIRCARCGKKALKAEDQEIRQSEQFKTIRKQEDMYT